jgi:hypothetical protein
MRALLSAVALAEDMLGLAQQVESDELEVAEVRPSLGKISSGLVRGRRRRPPRNGARHRENMEKRISALQVASGQKVKGCGLKAR